MSDFSLPTGFSARPAGPEDAGAILRVTNAYSQVYMGTNRALSDARGRLRLARYVPDEALRWVVENVHGTPVAIAFLATGAPYVAIEAGLVLDPDTSAADLYPGLLRELEKRSRHLLSRAPNGARVVLQIAAMRTETVLLHHLKEAGFLKAREWVHFVVEMDKPPAAPVWPNDIHVRPMDPRVDWPSVGAAMDEAFADHWGELARMDIDEAQDVEVDEEQQIDALEDDPYWNSEGLCFVAATGNGIAGVCLCNAKSIEWPDAGRLGSLSVRRPYRRQGIGLALSAHALKAFYDRGIRRVVTDTDANSFTGANRLYPRLGFEPFRVEWTLEKLLRAGTELRHLSADALGL